MANPHVSTHKRIRELLSFFRSRYGVVLPNDDAGRLDGQIAIDHLVKLDDGSKRARNFGSIWMPWLAPAELETMISSAVIARRYWDAEELGCELCLALKEREALGITTIRPGDMSPDSFAEHQRQRRAARAREDRRRKRVERSGIAPPITTGPFMPRQQSILDALASGPTLQSMGDVKAKVKWLPCWRDGRGGELKPETLRRIINHELDALITVGAVEPGPRIRTKFGTEARQFRLKPGKADWKVTHVLSREAGTRLAGPTE